MEPEVQRRLETLELRLAQVESVEIDNSAELKTLQGYLQAFRREWKLETDVKHEQTHARQANLETKANRVEVAVRQLKSKIDIVDTSVGKLATRMDGFDTKLSLIQEQLAGLGEVKRQLEEILGILRPKH